MKRLLFALLLLPLFLFSAQPQAINVQELIPWVKQHFAHEGPLRQAEDGMVYVKLPNDLIFDLNGHFKQYALPPYFGPDKVGAHITVITKEEIEALKCPKISELGEPFCFEFIKFQQIPICGTGRLKGVSNIVFIKVESPSLEKLREKYGLPPKIQGRDFHITIGVRYEQTTSLSSFSLDEIRPACPQ